MRYINYAGLMPALLLTSISATSEDNTIDEIEITATRTPISAQSAPTSVTVISAEDIKARQITHVADYLKTVPGLGLASSGSIGGTVQLRLRGSEANQTLVLIDGVEVNDPAAGDEFQFEHLMATSIERIEVIRSPMSAAWGSDALSGVINIITKKATEPFNASVYGEYGAFDTKRFGGNMGASGNGWRLNAGLGHSKSDGVNVSRSGEEADGYKNTTVNISGAVDLAENVKLSMSARHNDATANFDSTDWMTGLPSDSDNYTDTKKTYLSSAITAKLFDGRLNERLRVTYLDTEIANFAFGASSGTTAAERVGLYWDNQIEITDGHDLTLAIDHESTDFSQRGVASPWGNPNHDQSTKVTGYLADYVGDLTDGFTLSASLRRDDNSDFEDVTSWRLGGAYKLSDKTRIFANMSKGQKAPTFIERFGFFADQFLGNPDVKPEHAKAYEIGVEYRWDQITASAVYFNTRLTDEINGFAFDPATFMFTAQNKAEKSKRSGVELSVDGQISDSVYFGASYSYINATEGDGMGGDIRELRRPEHNGAISINWLVSEALSVNLSASYTGKALDVFYPPWPMQSKRMVMDNYTLVRIAADYKISDMISLYGRVENALDETYEDVYGYSTAGAGAYAGLRVTF